jgi:hypothetical protein
MTSINPINVNTQGIGAGFLYAQGKQNNVNNNQEPVKENQQQAQAQVKPDDVFSYMANSAGALIGAANAKGISGIDTSKYVDAESRARIEKSMNDFQNNVNTGMTAVNKEFPNMSDGAKMAVVLNQINTAI